MIAGLDHAQRGNIVARGAHEQRAVHAATDIDPDQHTRLVGGTVGIFGRLAAHRRLLATVDRELER